MRKSIFAAVLAAALTLCSCASGSDVTTPADTYEPADTVTETGTQTTATGETTQTPDTTDGTVTDGTVTDRQTEPPAERTDAPEIKGTVVTAPGEAIVYGTCENDCELYVSANGYSCTARSDGVYFAVPVTYSRSVNVTISAAAEGKNRSEEVSALLKYKKNAGDTGVTATLGSRVVEKKVLPDMTGENAFDGDEEETVAKAAAYRVRKTAEKAEKDVKVVYIIVPDPLTVYPEELTDDMKAGIIKKNARFDQAVAALGSVEGVTVIDLRGAMRQNLEKGKLYYKLDSHWTELGAYYGYGEIMTSLGMTARPLSDFDVKYIDIDDTDMNVYSGVGTGEMYESAPFVSPRFEPLCPYFLTKEKTARFWNFANRFFTGKTSVEHGDPDGPTALMLFDSYGFNLIPFIAEHFGTFVTQPVWHYNVDYSLVKKYKPDYVIELLAERDLGELLSST